MGRFLLAMGLLIGPGRAGDIPSFAVVVNQSNPTNELSLPDLRAMFEGLTRQWPHGQKVVLNERQPESPSFRFLTARLLNTSVIAYKRSLATIEFSGQAPVLLKVLNSEETACKYMFYVPGSIALVETDSLHSPECAQLKVLRIEGKLPAEKGYRLR